MLGTTSSTVLRESVACPPGACRAAARVPCLAGPQGTGKTSLTVAVAEELGRNHVRVALDEHHTGQVIELPGTPTGRSASL